VLRNRGIDQRGRCEAIGGVVVACWLALGWSLPARAQTSLLLPVAFHVVHVDGAPVVERSFIEQRLAQANRIFAQYGVGFTEHSGGVVPATHAAIESRSDRDALGSYVRAGVINCFLVRSLRDVDDPARVRRGVHWHVQGRRDVHFVILSAIAEAGVLAHELGHFLGNARHSEVPGNLMSYQRGSGLPVLDRVQLRRAERSICHYVRSGELRLPDEPRAACRRLAAAITTDSSAGP
jgi:hypothetical protein